MSLPFLRLLARRYALGAALVALVPVLLGIVAGKLWPEYAAQYDALQKLGVMKLVRLFARGDLIPPDSATFVFQLPFVHPVTMLALIVSMALPALGWPAGARGRGALDLVLATPLSRGALVATTFAFTLPFALLHAAAPLTGAWIGASLAGVADGLPWSRFLRVSVEEFALGLFFAGAALLLSVGLAPRRALRGPEAAGALGALAGVVLFALLAEIVATWFEPLRWLKWATPFGWYEPPQVLAGTVDPWRDAAVLGGAGLLQAALAWRNERARRSV